MLLMKSTKKITFCGIMAAITVVIMLTSYFPYLTYAIPAMASIFILIPTLEIGIKWGFLTFLVSGTITMLVGELESKFLFVVFLGYYPVLKELVERKLPKVLQYIVKFMVFNIALVGFYYISTKLLMIPTEEFTLGFDWFIYIMSAIANVTFFIYDIAISRLTTLYFIRFHNMFSKMLK